LGGQQGAVVSLRPAQVLHSLEETFLLAVQDLVEEPHGIPATVLLDGERPELDLLASVRVIEDPPVVPGDAVEVVPDPLLMLGDDLLEVIPRGLGYAGRPHIDQFPDLVKELALAVAVIPVAARQVDGLVEVFDDGPLL